MATFAIVRADGSVDKVTDGASVQDVSDRYGAPGNGSIAPWDEGEHGSKLANTFQSPAEQHDAWLKVAEAEGQFDTTPKSAAAAAPAEGPSASDVAVKVLVATHTREQLDELAEKQGVEGTFNTKSDVAAAIVAATED